MSWLGVAPIFFNCLSPRLRVSRAIRAETRESMEPPSLVRLSDKYSMRAGESPKATAVMDGRARVDVVSLTGARRLGTVSKKRCGVPAYAVRPHLRPRGTYCLRRCPALAVRLALRPKLRYYRGSSKTTVINTFSNMKGRRVRCQCPSDAPGRVVGGFKL